MQSSLKLESLHLTVGWPKYRTLSNISTIFLIDCINICTVQFKLVTTLQASTYAIRPCRLIYQVKVLNLIHYLKSVLRVNIICHVRIVSTRIHFKILYFLFIYLFIVLYLYCAVGFGFCFINSLSTIMISSL